jgi:hypothetical protein
VPAATPATGAHTVRLPVVLTSQALVRISPSGNPGDGDTSDVPFTLDPPSLAVAAPDTNVTWPIGSIQSVAWAHNLGTAEQVQIDVSRDGGATWESVAATLANSGSSSGTFPWPVTGPETATARIRVNWLHDTTVADASDVDFVIGAASSHAGTTRYVSKTGIDTGECTDAVIPCRTIRYGISTMNGGDTLIVGDGTYTEANAIREVPSGNSGPDGTPGTADDVYTTIRAETDFGVLIDGSAWPDSWIYGIRLENKSYITVRGFRVHGRQSNETGGPLHVQGSHHIKLIRCGFAYGGVTGNTANGDLGPDNDYVLIEESYAFGGARYQFLNYWGDHTVIRRSVARNDYWNDSLQAAAFVNYDSVRTVWQNNIAIDSNSGCCTGHSGLYAAFFSENKSDHAADTSQEFHGNIVLNFEATYGAHLDWVASGARVLRDNIYWHATGGYWGDQGPGTAASWPLIANLTSGAMTDTYNGPNDGAGLGTGISIYGNLQNVVRNSLFVNNNSYGVADFVNGDFNAFWGNGANYGGTRMPLPGVNDITTHDVLFHETTNPFGSLKYLPRGPEDGSLLATAGENASRVGAQVLWKIGLDGTLYGEPGWDVVRSPENGYGRDEDRLWPFPNEAVIKAEMGSYSGPGLPGARGFAAPGTGLYGGPTTLTSYIWEYLGHPCPPDVCR